MLVAVSDLHFEEEQSERVAELRLPKRNFNPAAFERFIEHLSDETRRNSAQRLDLVLAGDIFDLHRTQLWFLDPSTGDKASARPYVSCAEVAADPRLEEKILEILMAIQDEPEVRGSLAALRNLGSKFPDGFPVELHYIPGNHDRLANATDRIRATVREMLGISGTGPFPNEAVFDDPAVVVRHGHEYDRFNFAQDNRGSSAPLQIDPQAYGKPTFGDFITVQVASRLPNAFRDKYREELTSSRLHQTLYRRLLRFDDVRPQSALFDFLLNPPGLPDGEDEAWKLLKPIAKTVLKEASRDKQVEGWMKSLDVPRVVRTLFTLRAWKLGLPLWAARRLAESVRGHGDGPDAFAIREPSIRNGEKRFLIAGHTHRPQVAHLQRYERQDVTLKQYYIDTGTWRNRLLQGRGQSFGQVKALTYVIVYASGEDRGRETPPGTSKAESFDFWSGYTQRWPVAQED